MSAARRSWYNQHEAWVLHTDHWVEISRILRGNAVRELTKDKFDQLYPPLCGAMMQLTWRERAALLASPKRSADLCERWDFR
jgi:hypothetical protein